MKTLLLTLVFLFTLAGCTGSTGTSNYDFYADDRYDSSSDYTTDFEDL